MDYKSAGVDIEAGYKSVELIKKHVASTMLPEVLGGIGGFAGAFDISFTKKMKEPVLVSGTDGCGTKVQLAFIMDKHDTIGVDCVAMCVNDIVCGGGVPLFFLDYIACGKNYPEKIAQIVSGVAEGCRQAECALVGGETAEHPGLMPEDEYDLAGFAVGVVDKPDILGPDLVKEGDVLIGIASSGFHSNGYSLIRKVFDVNEKSLNKHYDELGMTLGESLLTPTKIYIKCIKSILESGQKIHAVSHITGGGFYENIPRMLPDGMRARINLSSYEVPPVFKLLQRTGNISDRDMYNTFNMGIGMVISVKNEKADAVVQILKAIGEDVYIIGEVIKGDKGIDLC